MLAHKAVHEAHVAAEVIAGEMQGNKELAAAALIARVIPTEAYSDPEVACVEVTEDKAHSHGKILGCHMVGEIAHGRCTDVPPMRKQGNRLKLLQIQ
jgi:hypothetical protein